MSLVWHSWLRCLPGKGFPISVRLPSRDCCPHNRNRNPRAGSMLNGAATPPSAVIAETNHGFLASLHPSPIHSLLCSHRVTVHDNLPCRIAAICHGCEAMIFYAKRQRSQMPSSLIQDINSRERFFPQRTWHEMNHTK
jgi:hypothetical protein